MSFITSIALVLSCLLWITTVIGATIFAKREYERGYVQGWVEGRETLRRKLGSGN